MGKKVEEEEERLVLAVDGWEGLVLVVDWGEVNQAEVM